MSDKKAKERRRRKKVRQRRRDSASKQSKVNIENDTTYYGYHVVCLIDVLGQKKKLARWAELPEDSQTSPEFIEDIRDTVGTVLAFREGFIRFFDQSGQCTMPDRVAALGKEQMVQYHRAKEYSVNVERFADTFVFSSQILNSHGDTSIMPAYHILNACCMAMLWSLEGKTPIRGAITIGAGAVLEDNSFYGHALAEAHHLESEVADYPRIILSPNFQSFLAEGHKYSSDPVVSSTMKEFGQICRSLVCQDEDGCFCVDFLGKGVRSILTPESSWATAATNAYHFVRSEAIRFRDERNTKLARRYSALQRYIESRLPLWE